MYELPLKWLEIDTKPIVPRDKINRNKSMVATINPIARNVCAKNIDGAYHKITKSNEIATFSQ